MITFLYTEKDHNFSKYNYLEQTFTPNDPSDCWSFEWLLDTVDIKYKNTTLNKKKNYVKFNLHFPTEYIDLQNMPNELWNFVKDSEHTNLLLYQATEATPYYYWKYRWNRLKSFLLNKGIPPEKVYYICGDLNAVKNHKKYNDEYWSKVNVLGIDIFEMMHLYRHTKISGKNYQDIVDQHFTSQKNKNFLNLNKRMRPNKQALVYYLEKNNLVENNLVSNLWYESEILTPEEFSRYNFDQSLYEQVKNIVDKKLIIDVEDNDQNSDARLYLSTKYSLVSETYTGSTVKFITEKSYKPILMGHPFVIHGTTGSLEYLRRNGYETFPELFDESYDTFSNPKNQLKIVVENLKKDITIDKHIIEKCRFNQNLFLQQPTKNITRDKLLHFLI